MGMLPPLGSRDLRALLVFFGGVVALFAFFAAGAYVGRWPRPSAVDAPQAAAPPRADSEPYLVEVAAFETEEKADDLVQKLRKKYTSMRGVYEPADRLFHVYAGPYPADQANAVAEDLRRDGVQSVTVKPFAPPAPTT